MNNKSYTAIELIIIIITIVVIIGVLIGLGFGTYALVHFVQKFW